ncbi:MAG: hypothetical protein IPH74_12785 [Bacteroidetes bacterium]|nr:hypothetical protein [Bacteroidota bacterium]
MEEEKIHNEVDSEKDENSILDVLKDSIRIFWEITRLALRFWFLLPLLPFLFIFGAYKYTENFETSYSSKLTFMINQEASDPSAVGAISSGQIGLGSGGLSPLTFNPEKIRQLSSTNKLITLVLFQKVIIENKEDFLINHLIRIQKLGYGDSYFKSFVSVDSFSREQVSALGYVQSIVKGGSFSLSYDESKIFTIVTSSTNEELAYNIGLAFYNTLSDYYIQKTTERARLTYDFLKLRLDSIKNELYAVEYQIGKFADQNHNLALTSPLIENERNIKRRDFLGGMYYSTMQNFEAAKVNVQNETPIFQIIDKPYYPLPWDKQTKKIYFILAVAAGIIADILFVILFWLWKRYGADTLQFFRDAVTENNDSGSDDHSTDSV